MLNFNIKMSNKFISSLSKIIILVVMIVGIVFVFVILSNSEDSENITDKNEEEVRYLETKILSLINYLNNINLQNYKLVLTKIDAESAPSSNSSKKEEGGSEQENGQKKGSDQEDSTESGTDNEEKRLTKMEEETIVTNNNEIDWKTIEGELEVLTSVWPSIVLDLYESDINSEDILNFSSDLDETIKNAKNKDKALSCMYLAKLYSYLPKFLDKNVGDEVKRETLEAKTYIINSYSYAETQNWDKMNSEIEKAENIFTSLVNDARFVNDGRKYYINKGYVVIGELKKSLSVKDTKIFYIKYKNALETLNIIS